MPHRIEIRTVTEDARARILQQKITAMGFAPPAVSDLQLIDVYAIDKDLTFDALKQCADLLTNPVTQASQIDKGWIDLPFDQALETGFLPGVTDNVGNSAQQMIEDLLKTKFAAGEAVYASQLLLLRGSLSPADTEKIGSALINPLIQRLHIKSAGDYLQQNGMDNLIPKVRIQSKATADTVNLKVTDEDLVTIGKKGILDHIDDAGKAVRRGPLALDLPSMQAIQAYFRDTEMREPTDAELETLAQTWSEHCKHTIFAAELDEIKDGLYKHYIKRATAEIRASKGNTDFCVSVFTDNSGAIEFDENYLITDKAETHNSPSALDPFGGAVTGIVGVNRDTIGFGLGAKPIINRYGFCFADPRTTPELYRGKDKTFPALPPRKILDGVIAGVNSGGNCSGVPTPQGFVYFDQRFSGKPLVFVGTIGLIPRTSAGRPADQKQAQVGDKIVMVGGRVGKDGIHGATFSSEGLDSGSPATAVQIGDPITQKKLSDAIVKEARDLGLYNAITDNGAGGLSSSVGEMAKDTDGCIVDLDLVPRKYPGLSPWETWISESQERMTLAVPADKVDTFNALMTKRGVESTVIGEFNASGRCIVLSGGQKVVDLSMDFMHDGTPHKVLTSTYTPAKHEEPAFAQPSDLAKTLQDMLSRLNVCSYAFISHQFDHLVQGTAALQPLQGSGQVNSDATVTRPLFDSPKGVVTTQAIFPAYSDIDTAAMATYCIDATIARATAVGADPDRIALMDNFCWCDSTNPERLGQLRRAVEAVYNTAVAYGTPLISGKDSMFNDFKGFDKDNQPVLLSVPPTLLVSGLSVLEDVTKAVSLEPKLPGDLVYVLGETKDELGASEYFAHMGETISGHKFIGNQVPQVNTISARKRYQTLHQAIDKRLVASALAVGIGGIGTALSKAVIAAQLGMEIDLSKVPQSGIPRDDHLLFAESASRLIVTVRPQNQSAFEALFAGQTMALIGTVVETPTLILTTASTSINLEVAKLTKAYQEPLAKF